jgi:DNA polymerase
VSGAGDGGPTTDRRALAEWVAYLRDIGVKELRVAAPGPGEADVRREPSAAAAPPVAAPASAAARPAPRKRPQPIAAPDPGLFDAGFDRPPPEDPAARLSEIRDTIGDCTRCKLHEQRTNVVFGVGDPRSRLMFIGEGPGAEEDAQGEPFVGRAGKKLDEMIVAIGLSREQVYIANIVKCRPPQNRDPERDEVETCSPFLIDQIEAIRPRVIVTLGAPATRTLLNTRVGITRLRGSWQSFRGIPVMPTFHPAYLLRAYTPENRRKVWEDLKAARARMDGSE